MKLTVTPKIIKEKSQEKKEVSVVRLGGGQRKQ